MSANEFRDAMQVVLDGGVGFVPLPSSCREHIIEAMDGLVKLGRLRKSGAIVTEQWGYAPDHKMQFDRGLSQWRDDECKDVFHFEPQTPETLHEQGVRVCEWRNFFDSYGAAWRCLYEIGLACAEEADRLLPGHGFHKSCLDFGPFDPLRFLAYERRRPGMTETAYPHVDRSFLSLHPYETASGFFIKRQGEDATEDVPIPTTHAAIFPGLKFQKMTLKRVPALVHGTREVPDQEPDGRRAAVFFLHTNVSHLE